MRKAQAAQQEHSGRQHMADLYLPPWPWDTPPRALLDQLTGQLAGLLHAGPVYLLIDPAIGREPADIQVDAATAGQWPNGPQRARDAAWGRAVHTLHTEDLDDPHVLEFPYLVCLADANDPLLSQSVEWAIQEHLTACARGAGLYRIGGWLQVHGPADEADERKYQGPALARQLNRLIRRQGQLARLWDRRVLHLLRGAGTGIDWAGALKGIRGWDYLDHNLRLQTIAGRAGEPANTRLLPGDVHGGAPTNAGALLTHAEAIHGAQTLLLADFFPLSDDALPVIIEKVQSVAHRLNYQADRAAYAAEALREPAFEHWPKLDALLRAVRATRNEFGDVLAAYRHRWAGKPADHWKTTP
jgi:hypothetical protein